MRTIVSLLYMLAGMLLFACTPEKPKAFIDKLMPAPVDGGFAIEDSWIWGSSVIKGEDGNYHIFADKWD